MCAFSSRICCVSIWLKKLSAQLKDINPPKSYPIVGATAWKQQPQPRIHREYAHELSEEKQKGRDSKKNVKVEEANRGSKTEKQEKQRNK